MYGFVVNVDGNALTQMRKIEAGTEHLDSTVKTHTHNMESSFTSMGEKVKGIFGELKGIIAGGLFAGGIFGGYEFIKNSKEASEGLEKAIVRVDTALQSTHFAAGLTSLGIQDQAKELSKGILNSRSEIMDAQGMLLSFTGIKGPVFGQATKAVADFATFYKTDMTSAALQIGKALNDPAKGMNKLQRMGVAFTDEQKKQIQNYQEQGKLALAQGVILKELQTEFGGQAHAATLTDSGKVQMAKKDWGALKLQIGEIASSVEVSLIPTFKSMVTYIKEGFNSAPVQFFLGHIGDLVKVAVKLIPIWLTYKATMMGINLVTSAFSISNGVLTASFGSLTVMTDGATIATEGFSSALVSTGIGAFAVGIGLVIEKLISMNSELDETIEKKYKLSDSDQFFKSSSEKYESIKERMGIYNQLGTKEKQSLSSDIQDYLKTAREKIPIINNRATKLKQDANAPHASFMQNLGTFSSLGFGNALAIAYGEHQENSKTAAASAQMAKNAQTLGKTFPELKEAMAKLSKDGIKPMSGAGGNKPLSDAANNTSNLSGASGGLGEAKIINIHFHDALQKVSVADGKGVVKSGQDAIEFMIRTINNMAYSQSTTM